MKWFNNLKMVQKLVSAFVLVALFIGIVGFIGNHSMKNMDKNMDNIYNIDLVGIKTIDAIKSNLQDVRINLLVLTNPVNKNLFQTYNNKLVVLKNQNDALNVVYKTTITTELDRQRFAAYEKLLVDYYVIKDKMVKEVGESNYINVTKLTPNYIKITNEVTIALEKVLKSTTDNTKVDYDNSQSTFDSALGKSNITIILGLFVAIALGLIIAISISRQT